MKTLLLTTAILLSITSMAAAEEYTLSNSPRNPAVIYDAYRLFPADVRAREQYIATNGGQVETAARRIFPNEPNKQAEFVWNNRPRGQ